MEVDADGRVRDYAVGFTTLTDIKFGPDGHLYGVKIGDFDAQKQSRVPDTGAVYRIGVGGTRETVMENLQIPTSIGFDGVGNAYLSTGGVGAPGSGEVTKYPGIAVR